MVIVQTLAPRQPGEDQRVIRCVAEVLRASPVTESVDEWRDDEDVEDGMRRGDQPGPQAEGEAQERRERRAQADTGPAP